MPKPNLNTASIAELMSLRGMDPATAFYICRIRRVREITSWADLAERLRLSPELIESFRSQAAVGRQPNPASRASSHPPR